MWHYAGMQRFYTLHRAWPQQLVLRLAIALAAADHLARLVVKGRRDPQVHTLLAAYARVVVRAVTP
jgi:hypothetical protein